jgi:cation diffusion facilitator CzcD-associated flavoprotein CzcO
LLPKHSIRKDFRAAAALAPMPVTGHNDIYKLFRKGKINVHKGNIKEFNENGIVMDNGDTIECDLVLLATGHHFTGIDYLGEKYQHLVRTYHVMLLLCMCIYTLYVVSLFDIL